MPATQTPTKIWTELRVLREKDGHSLTSLARATEVKDRTGKTIQKAISLGYLSDLENGKREPTAPIRKRLARALNVPVSMLEKHRRDVP